MAYLDIDGRHVAYRLLGGEALPLVVMAHPLGMNQSVWDAVLPAMLGRYRALSWDLPGHGGSAAWPQAAGALTPERMAADVLALADHAGAGAFHFVGTSIGGVLGQQLLAQAPERLLSAMLTNTGAVIGTAAAWTERAARVRREGLTAMAGEIVPRWFAPALLQAEPALGRGWQTQLARSDGDSYARLCELLGDADYRGRLASIATPVTVLGGREDVAAPEATIQVLARECGAAPAVMLDGVGHVPSIERPAIFARHLLQHLAAAGTASDDGSVSYAAGLATRKQVLGAEHVARASHNATSLDAPFQRMITRLAWGELWGNPDLSRAERSMITIAVLAALGRDGELELHLKTARRIGLTEAQLRQALMHVAIYAGVPAANHAFAMAKQVGWGAVMDPD